MFKARAYIGVKTINPFIGLTNSIESHNIDDCICFIWDELQQGHNCILEYGTITRYFNANLFNETTEDVNDCEINLV